MVDRSKDVSVIIPFYKGNKYICNLLKMLKANALDAKGISIEAIIVNDYPEIDVIVDRSLIEGYELRIIKHEKNKGIHQARVTGINVARGEYILMLDQDDKIESNTIKSQYYAVRGKDAVVSNGYSQDLTGNKTKLFRDISQMSYINYLPFYFYFGNVIASPGLCMIKKSVLPELWLKHIMIENGADDWILWVDYLNRGGKFAINDACLYTHINDGNNTSNNDAKMLKSSYEAMNIVYNSMEFDTHLIKVYRRRLHMRSNYTNKNALTKIMAYIMNPDIAFWIINYKVSRKIDSLR